MKFATQTPSSTRLFAVIAFLFVAILAGMAPVIAESNNGTSSSVNESKLTLDSATPYTTNSTQILNRLIAYYLQDGKGHGPAWLRTTDINLLLNQDNSPMFSVETIQPFGGVSNKNVLWFWQGRLAYQSDEATTANFGVGQRRLSLDQRKLFGLNAFYDHSFDYDHSRLGLGAEYFSDLTETRINVYIPISGAREVGVRETASGYYRTYERAVRGVDLETGSTFKHAPWLGVFLSGFFFDNEYSDNLLGYKLRAEMQLTPRFSLEAGYIGSNQENDPYLILTYKFSEAYNPSRFGENKGKYTELPMSYKIIQKVRRDNTIKTERYTVFDPFKGSIRASVTNGNAQPVEGATVQAYQDGLPVGDAAVTDASGNAILSGLKIGSYTVRASYYTYSDESAPVQVLRDQATDVALTLPIIGGNVNVDVITDSSEPVEGAEVTALLTEDRSANPLALGQSRLEPASFSMTVRTDVNGRAIFTNLPLGVYQFVVRSNSQQMTSIPVPIQSQLTSDTTVILASTGGNIHATVKDAGNNAVISGATVELLDGETVVGQKTTDDTGTVTFSSLSTQKAFTLRATYKSYIVTSASITPEEKLTKAVDIPLDIRNSASVTVNDGSEPLNGATVSVTVNNNEYISTTDAQGKATISDLPSGHYTFTATKGDYDSNTVDITVADGVDAAGTISLTRQTGGATITVTDGTDPLPGASVTLNGKTLTTNAQGKVTFSGIVTGTYTANAQLTKYDSNSADINVTDRSTATATIALVRQKGNAAITVTDGTDPLSGATVTLHGQTKTTDADGKASFSDIPTGDYTASAQLNKYDSNSVDVTVTHGGNATATVALTRQTGGSTITVTDGTDSLSGANVTLNGHTLTTNAQGKVTFTDVPTGDYTASAELEKYDSNSASISISDGTTATATIALTRQTGDATITVTDGTNPLSGASVSLNGQNKTTDADGKASFSDIPTGDYTATVHLNKYDDNSAEITVTDGGKATATVPLTRQTGNATITVTDGTNPLSGASVTLNGKSATSNAQGKVSFSDVPTGDYTASAELEKYDSNTASVSVTDDGSATATIALARQTGSATVTITDGTNPLSGANVTLNGQTKTTAANGKASFTDIPTGGYTATAELNKYDGNSVAVTITHGGNATATIALTRQTGAATITVTDGTNPLSGASVTLNGKTATSNAQGKASFSDVPTGDYAVSAELGNYDNNTASVTVTNGGTATATIALTRQTGGATITVTDGTNPLSGASVTLNGKTLTTNAQGKVSFTDTPTGKYTASAELKDYDGNSAEITVVDGSTATATIALTRQTGGATITVTDGASPLSGASVTLNGNTLSTNAQGKASFQNVPTGDYTATVSLAGYDNNSAEVSVADGATATATMALTRQTGGATITVTDGTDPLSGASVTLNGQTKATDANGKASFANIPTGDYTASVQLNKYDSNSASITVTKGGNATATIALTRQTGDATITVTDGTNPLAGASVTMNGKTLTSNAQGKVSFVDVPTGDYNATAELDKYDSSNASVIITDGGNTMAAIALTRQTGSATITVTDGTNPISGVSVTLNGKAATTNAQGKASFSNVPTGTYTAAASLTGYDNNSVEIIVANGSTATASVALTRQTGGATITITDGTNPLSGASVTLNGKTSTTNAQGKVSFADVPTGDYTASAELEKYDSNTAGVTITKGGTATATVELTRQTGSATITVADGANPLAGVSVTLNGQTLKTDAQGKVTFNAPTGDYTAQASLSGYDNNSVDITIANGATAIGAIAITRQTGSATITVTDGTNPLSGASVTLNGKTLTTDAEGKVDFANVPTGDYSVTASLKDYDNNSANITITDGANATKTIALTRQTGSATITITDSGSNPLAGATVKLNGQSATTDAEGKASFSDIPTGKYTASAELADYNSNTVDVTITDSGNATETIVMSQGTGGVVTVNYGSDPLEGAYVCLYTDTDPDYWEAYTGADGKATFDKTPPGTYYVYVYDSISGDSIDRLTITIPKNGMGTLTVNAKLPKGNATITVLDGATPVNGASVTVGSKSGTSDASGQVTLTDIGVGDQTIIVTHNIYATNSSQTVTITEGNTASATVHMQKKTCDTYAIQVIGSGGIGSLGGASVTFNGETKLTNPTSGMYGGCALFYNVPYGTYDVTVSKAGYKTVNTTATVDQSGFYLDNIYIDPQ